MNRPCGCPYCRALIVDDRPPAHFTAMPNVRELAEQAGTREPARRVSRRGPVPRGGPVLR